MHTFYIFDSQFSCKVRVFAEGLKASSAPRVSNNIDTRSQCYISSFAPEFSAECFAYLLNDSGIPSGTKCQFAWETGRLVNANSVWTVCHCEAWYSEPLIVRRSKSCFVTAHLSNLFFQCHLRKQSFNSHLYRLTGVEIRRILIYEKCSFAIKVFICGAENTPVFPPIHTITKFVEEYFVHPVTAFVSAEPIAQQAFVEICLVALG